MAPEQTKTKGKKAKGALDATTATRKSSRISDQSAVKRKAAEDVSPIVNKKLKAEKVAKKDKKDKKEEVETPSKKSKVQKVVGEEKEEEVPAPTPAKKAAKKTKKTAEKPKKATKAAEPAEPVETEAAEEETTSEDQGDHEAEDDDTTKALVQQLDSGDEAEEGGASLFTAGQDVGKVPVGGPRKGGASPAGGRGKALLDGPPGGVVYIGRIPHGFFEHEMRSYFSQFGEIRRLRLSRNKRTGASKHYAFVEFSDPDVAAIVAQTMDNYLLFGHLLRCSVVPPEQVPANLFVGANRRFKVVPWNRLAGRQLAAPKTEAAWEAKAAHETRRRSKRASLLQEKLGYVYEAPGLKQAVAAEKEETEAVEAAEAVEAVEAAPAESEVAETKALEAPAAVEEEETAAAVVAAPEKTKAKKAKGKKSKA